jgi:hypothetical protein
MKVYFPPSRILPTFFHRHNFERFWGVWLGVFRFTAPLRSVSVSHTESSVLGRALVADVTFYCSDLVCF